MADAAVVIRNLEVECGQQDLAQMGFTPDADELVMSSTKDIFAALVDKATVFAEADKQAQFGREVTTQHVQHALNRLTGPLQRPIRPKWSVFANICEYVLTIAAGAGLGNLKEPWGPAVAIIAGLLAIALVSIRHIYVERDR